MEAGVLDVAVLGEKEFDAGLGGLLCATLFGVKDVVFAGAGFSELTPEVVEVFLVGLDLILFLIRGGIPSSDLGESGLEGVLLVGLLEGIFTATFLDLPALYLILELLFSALAQLFSRAAFSSLWI